MSVIVACPKCGTAMRVPEASPIVRATSMPLGRRRRTENTGLIAIVVGLNCLVLGYFAGREHLKYEMSTTLKQATEVFREGFKSSTPRPGGNDFPQKNK